MKSTNQAPEEAYIQVTGAREHNLKNIDIRIPRNQLVVITGVSGSGKSSLAFDTVYAEGQRRYLETFSAYARQFLGGLERPAVDQITGLSPVISIEQKKQFQKTRAPPSGPSLKCMTFFVSLLPGHPMPIASPRASRWFGSPMKRSLKGSLAL
jgi:excinuclease UvrABC ATPase subunit